MAYTPHRFYMIITLVFLVVNLLKKENSLLISAEE